MEIKEYSRLAIRTANLDRPPMTHAAMGIAGESGEIIDIVKKVVYYDKPIDRQHLVEEAGDLTWYINLLLHSLDVTWEEMLSKNIAKLEARYPDLRFDADHAINRDKAAEQSVFHGES